MVHIGTLKIASKTLPQVFPTIDGISWEMVQPCYGGFSQIDREELDDEQINVCPSRSTCETVILKRDAGVGFAIIFSDVASHLKASQKMGVAHGTSEYLRTGHFWAMWVSRAWLGMHIITLGDAVGTSEVPTGHSSIPSGRGSKIFSMRKPSPCLELLEWPSVSRLQGWRGAE
jgi:hypothetical protein